jgi:ATP-dependent Clp protease ATP-binding subunit ClpC
MLEIDGSKPTPYTENMRDAIIQSKTQAGRLGHSSIGPEHYLLGILSVADCRAVKILTNLGVDIQRLCIELEKVAGHPEFQGPPYFAPNSDALKVLAITKSTTCDLGHSMIGTEHMLLAIALNGQFSAAHVLAAEGVTVDSLRNEVIKSHSP